MCSPSSIVVIVCYGTSEAVIVILSQMIKILTLCFKNYCNKKLYPLLAIISHMISNSPICVIANARSGVNGSDIVMLRARNTCSRLENSF